jgi:hypothetical protein
MKNSTRSLTRHRGFYAFSPKEFFEFIEENGPFSLNSFSTIGLGQHTVKNTLVLMPGLSYLRV